MSLESRNDIAVRPAEPNHFFHSLGLCKDDYKALWVDSGNFYRGW